MRDCDVVDVADLALGEPGAQVARHARAHQTALVTTDRVERERGAGVVHLADVAVGHKTQLHQRLEARCRCRASGRREPGAGRAPPR